MNSFPQRPHVTVAAKENGQKQSYELWAIDMQLSFKPMLPWNKAKH